MVYNLIGNTALLRFAHRVYLDSYPLCRLHFKGAIMPKKRKSQQINHASKGGPGSSHPPGLRGKEIGLWYAAMNKPAEKDTKKAPKVAPLDITGINPIQIREAIDYFWTHHSKLATGNGSEDVDLQVNVSDSFKLEQSNSLDPLLAETAFGSVGEIGDTNVDALIDAVEDTLDVPTSVATTTNDSINSTADTLFRCPELDRQLLLQQSAQQWSPGYRSMLLVRQRLPAYLQRQQILHAIETNQVVLISGETGCGKTTQIPQFILEDQIARGNGSVTRIVVTQPRRISAISVAERVAAERGETIGQSIGYQVRLEHRYPKQRAGSIMYCTTGIVLQGLQSDPFLKTVSHIVVDEVHEREFLCDFLLTLLKRIRPYRPDLHVILMSATLNADRISAYFDNCPSFEIPGRQFPVQSYFLEDVLRMTNFWLTEGQMRSLASIQTAYHKRRFVESGLSRTKAKVVCLQPNRDLNAWIAQLQYLSPIAREILRIVGEDAYPNTDLIVHTIDYILQTTQEGAILVFVPGIGAIKDTIRGLRKHNPQLYGERSQRVRIFPLHSYLATSRHRGLFEVPPQGQRKIVISTNIAETSVTIEDVVHVIDCGRIKITNYDPLCNTYSLAPVLVSKANAAQRRGRAGRVQPGICYHLFPQYVFDYAMDNFLSPELLRIRLEDIILRIKLLNLGPVTSFLADCMDPPSSEAIERSLHFLREIQALNICHAKPELIDGRQMQARFFEKEKKRMKERLRQMTGRTTQDAQAGTLLPEYDLSYAPAMIGDEEDLSPLGKQLAMLPVDPQCGKLLLLGSIFACLEPALIVAACLSYRDPFEIPMEREMEARQHRIQLSQNTLSDHWVLVTAIQNFRQLSSPSARRQFCAEYYLREAIMQEIIHLMKDYAQLLYEKKYINSPNPLDPAANVNSNNFVIFRAILCGALYPNVLKMHHRMRRGRVLRPRYVGPPTEGLASIHAKSVNSLVYPMEPLWSIYFSKTRLDNSKRPTVTDSTIVPLRPLLFFGGTVSDSHVEKSALSIGSWILVEAEPKIAALMKELRHKFDHFLQRKFSHPSATNWDESSPDGRLLQTLASLLMSEPTPKVQAKSVSLQRNSANGLAALNEAWPQETESDEDSAEN